MSGDRSFSSTQDEETEQNQESEGLSFNEAAQIIARRLSASYTIWEEESALKPTWFGEEWLQSISEFLNRTFGTHFYRAQNQPDGKNYRAIVKQVEDRLINSIDVLEKSSLSGRGLCTAVVNAVTDEDWLWRKIQHVRADSTEYLKQLLSKDTLQNRITNHLDAQRKITETPEMLAAFAAEVSSVRAQDKTPAPVKSSETPTEKKSSTPTPEEPVRTERKLSPIDPKTLEPKRKVTWASKNEEMDVQGERTMVPVRQ